MWMDVQDKKFITPADTKVVSEEQGWKIRKLIKCLEIFNSQNKEIF